MNFWNFRKAMGAMGAMGTFAALVFLTASVTLPAYAAGKIVFVSNRDGNDEIYSMNSDGTKLTNLTNNAADDMRPSVSRDGSKIVFSSTREGSSRIYSMDGTGSNLRRVTQNTFAENDPCISPDGTKIAWSTNAGLSSPEIFLMNFDGTNPTRLTFSSSSDRSPCFNDDGSKILFTSSREGNVQIYEMNLDGKGQTNLSRSSSDEKDQDFHNGKIVFASDRDGNGRADYNEIYKMNADGSNQTRLTYTGVSETTPVWSPDSSQIAFSSSLNGNREIYVMNPDGSNPTRITDNISSDYDPVWVSALLAVTPTLSINDASINEGDSGSKNLAFTVKLSQAINRSVTVKVATSTSEGTATPDSDYTPVAPFFLTFEPGETFKIVNVGVKGDSAVEQDELFYVRLGSPTNATILDKSGTGKIRDDDTARTLSVNDVTFIEGEQAIFTVQLSGISGKTVTVKVATSPTGTATPGVDYTSVAPFFLTFAPGETTKTLSVPTKSDDLNEDSELFYVHLGSETNATRLDKSGTGRILNDDPEPTLSVNDVRVNEGQTANFTIRLSAPSGKTVQVKAGTRNETATGGADYTTVPSYVLTFAPGETTKTFSVPTTNDATTGDNETFSVRLSSPVNATIMDGAGFGTIINGVPEAQGDVAPFSAPSAGSL